MTQKKIIAKAKAQASERLLRFGIQDKFIVKVRDPKNNDWVAMYRGGTQFTNSRGPIFWVSRELLDNPTELVISLLHEYGHVIAEWAWRRGTSLKKFIGKHWKENNFYNRNWDEEAFAEEFAQFLFGDTLATDEKLMRKAIDLYVKDQEKFMMQARELAMEVFGDGSKEEVAK